MAALCCELLGREAESFEEIDWALCLQAMNVTELADISKFIHVRDTLHAKHKKWRTHVIVTDYRSNPGWMRSDMCTVTGSVSVCLLLDEKRFDGVFI